VAAVQKQWLQTAQIDALAVLDGRSPNHFPQWSTAFNEFTKLTAYITTKKEQ